MIIISGGQTGTDRAALEAAKVCGFKTGGIAPKGWLTTAGPAPELGELFGLTEDSSESYVPRTKKNVINADATLILSRNVDSPGTVLTIDEVTNRGKILRVVKLYRDNKLLHTDWPDATARWIFNNEFSTLNVAGNSEHSAPGIQRQAFEYLVSVFRTVTLEGS